MTIRGNYRVLYASQAVTGVLSWFASARFGIEGLAIGFLPFFFGMLLVMYKHQPDEREMNLSHQINSYESIGMGVIAGIIYLLFPDLNWFFALVSSVSFIRGLIGFCIFSLR